MSPVKPFPSSPAHLLTDHAAKLAAHDELSPAAPLRQHHWAIWPPLAILPKAEKR
jgi:hypothetical protein